VVYGLWLLQKIWPRSH